MADSDEEYDRRRGRDKFRGERNDYDSRRPLPPRGGGYDRGRGPPDRRGRDWDGSRGTKRDYYPREREIGRGSSPPSKRIRDNGYNDQAWRSGQQENTGLGTMPDPSQTGGQSSAPTIMSFKEFVVKQEDDVDPDESVKRYLEYKVEFKRTQINDFFVLHKDEEWFKEKYHPHDRLKREEEIRLSFKHRLHAFLHLFKLGYFDNVALNISNGEEILKLLDRVGIMLEGGSDKDVQELDKIVQVKREAGKPAELNEAESLQLEKVGLPKEENLEKPVPVKHEESNLKSEPYNYDVEAVESDVDNDREPGPPGLDDDEPAPPGMEVEDNQGLKKENDLVKKENKGINEDEVNVNILQRGSLSFLFDAESDGTQAHVEDKKSDLLPVKNEETEVKPKDDSSIKYVYDGSLLKRPLSLFMRSLPPTVTRQDLVDVCKRYPGFLRVSMSEPAPERRYFRRAWATFDHTVNIKDICWNLSNIKIKDNELNPVVNRDVSHRIRPISGMACTPVAMQLDVRLAIRLTKKLDEKRLLYADPVNGDVAGKEQLLVQEESESLNGRRVVAAIGKQNPVLAMVASDIENVVQDCEIKDEEDGKRDISVVVNERLAKALDRVLLYLRVVHCVDYYNGKEYPFEDEMPSRCGIIHVRDLTPNAASKKDVYDWCKQNAEKLQELFDDDHLAADAEAEKFGLKNIDEELENFVKANTQELAKDKWLCPLSGKKFRGPEFIRKHIFNKHQDSVENVKVEVQFFNNYVRDLRRPCFPDPKTRPPGAISSQPSVAPMPAVSASPVADQRWTPRQPAAFATPHAAYPNSHLPGSASTASGHGPSGQDTYGRINTYPPKQQRRDFNSRPIIKYRDLDAPDEGDFF